MTMNELLIQVLLFILGMVCGIYVCEEDIHHD